MASVQYTKVFDANIDAIIANTYRVILNRGGTRSTKTYSLSQIIVMRLLTGTIVDRYRQTGVWSVVRKHSTTARRTVMRDIQKILLDFGAIEGTHYKFEKRDMIFTVGGRMVEIFGTDDVKKVSGGSRDILLLNEGDELTYDVYLQLEARTKDFVIIDMNPSDADSRVNQKIEIEQARVQGGVKVIVSTYRDNPFLPERQVKAIEYHQAVNPSRWKVYGEGEYGVVEGRVFDSYERCSEVPDDADYLGHGIDFGFLSPSSVVGLWYYNGSLILDEQMYESGMITQEIHDHMIGIGMNQYDTVLYPDPAEPDRIKELQLLGWECMKVNKGKGSVMAGILSMKKYKILITERSPNIEKELRQYVYKQGSDGNFIDGDPVRKNDHAIDAARYVYLETLMKTGEEPDDLLDGKFYAL